MRNFSNFLSPDQEHAHNIQVRLLQGSHLGEVFGNDQHLVVYNPAKPLVNYSKPYFSWEFFHKSLMHQKWMKYKGMFTPVPTKGSYPPITPRQYIAERNNMTLLEISEELGLNPQIAISALARENGWPISKRVSKGEKVKIPDMQVNTSTFYDVPDYSKLMGSLIGNLSPYISFAQPKQHHSCVEVILRIVIPMVSIWLACLFPPAAVGLGSLMGIGLDVFAGVLGGLFDAIGQEIAIGVGLLHHFSWAEVLETASAAALNKSQFMKDQKGIFKDSIKAGPDHDISKAMGALMKVVALQGAMNVSLQMTEIAVGLKKKFDIKMLISVMATAALDMGISSKLPSPEGNMYVEQIENKWTDFANALIGNAIMGGDLNFENMLEQELGSTLGDFTEDFFGKGSHTNNTNNPTESEGDKTTKPPKTQGARTSFDHDYANAHANGQGHSQKYTHIPTAPDIQQETNNKKYALSVYNSTNKPVTSTNREMIKHMDSKQNNNYQNNYITQSIKNTWEHQWMNNLGLNKNYVSLNNLLSFNTLKTSGLNAVYKNMSFKIGFTIGFGKTMYTIGKGIYNMALHPINTLINIGSGVQELYSHPGNVISSFGTEMKKDWNILGKGGYSSGKLMGGLGANTLAFFGGGELIEGMRGIELTGQLTNTINKTGSIIKKIPKLTKNKFTLFGKGGKNLRLRQKN